MVTQWEASAILPAHSPGINFYLNMVTVLSGITISVWKMLIPSSPPNKQLNITEKKKKAFNSYSTFSPEATN